VLTLSILLGRKVFPVHFPIKPALQIAACTALMSIVLYNITFAGNLTCLIEMIGLGSIIYCTAFLGFNIMQCRTRLLTFIGARGRT
jgi:hypothetical protein